MNLRSWFNQTIMVQPQSGINWATGEPAWGTPRQVKCRIESRLQMVKDPAGQEVQSQNQIFTPEPIGLADRVWLPGENTSDPNVAHQPINVLGVPDRQAKFTLWQVYL